MAGFVRDRHKRSLRTRRQFRLDQGDELFSYLHWGHI